MPLPKIRENPVENYLLDKCRKHGFLCMKFVSPARGGVPDRLIVTPAGTIFVEVKRPGGKPDPRQVPTHAKIRRFGGQVFVVDTYQEIDALMLRLLHATPALPIPVKTDRPGNTLSKGPRND